MSQSFGSMLQATLGALGGAPILALLLKVTLLLVLGAAVAALLRNRSAAARHFVWSMSLVAALLLIPIGRMAPPLAVDVPVAPERAPALVTTAPPAVSFPEAKNIAKPLAAKPLAANPVSAPHPGVAATSLRSAIPIHLPIETIVWLTGFLGVLAWSIAGNLGMARLVRRARVVDDERWLSLVSECQKRSGIAVRVALSEEVSAPVTWGTLRSVVLLPISADSWPLEQRRAALMHEMAHVARFDSLTQLLASLVCAVYWFHPLTWIAMRSLRRESEHACDDRVLSDGVEGPDYASQLLAVAAAAGSRNLRRGLRGLTSLGMASHLEGRVMAVLDESRKRTSISRSFGTAALAIVGVLVIPLAAIRFDIKAMAAPVRHHDAQVTILDASDSSPSISLPEKTFDVQPGGILRLDLETGASVDIHGTDTSRVRIRGSAGGRSGNEIRVGAERSDEGVRVHSSYEGQSSSYSSSVKLEIDVPRSFDIELDSAGGDVRIENVEGSFHGSTGGGEIRLSNLKGEARLSTGGGDIRVSDCDLHGQVSTGGGKVELSRVRGGLRGDSGSGPVIYIEPPDGDDTAAGDLGDTRVSDSNITIGDTTYSSGRLHIQKAGGDIDLDKAPNGGDITTGGGDIEIGSTGGELAVSTGGGNLRIGPVAGSLSATTGAGTIDVIVADGSGNERSIALATGHGPVTIDLPRDFDGALDLETAYTRGFQRPTTIKSDWPISIETTREWDDTHGSPRRYVRGKAVLGGGRTVIKVRTVNGDVRVRRIED